MGSDLQILLSMFRLELLGPGQLSGYFWRRVSIRFSMGGTSFPFGASDRGFQLSLPYLGPYVWAHFGLGVKKLGWGGVFGKNPFSQGVGGIFTEKVGHILSGGEKSLSLGEDFFVRNNTRGVHHFLTRGGVGKEVLTRRGGHKSVF